ncbi:hypothetical protein D3C80_1133810 [compost metagenome]
MLHLADVLGRGQYLSSVERSAVLVGQSQEADRRVRVEQLDETCSSGADKQPYRWQQGDPHVALALHLDQHHGAEHQRDTGEHLVRDTEQRPQGVDAPQRIDHTLIQQVTPKGYATGGSEQVGTPRLGTLERWHEAT